ncbi:MAG: hypothetical protein KDH96_07335 [Candidatus Riesia sp.]|nr:hypothetical protein [Candidatus Riesia sp.]
MSFGIQSNYASNNQSQQIQQQVPQQGTQQQVPQAGPPKRICQNSIGFPITFSFYTKTSSKNGGGPQFVSMPAYITFKGMQSLSDFLYQKLMEDTRYGITHQINTIDSPTAGSFLLPRPEFYAASDNLTMIDNASMEYMQNIFNNRYNPAMADSSLLNFNQNPYQQGYNRMYNQNPYQQQPMQQGYNNMYPQQQGYNNMYNQNPYQQQPMQQYMNQMYPQQQQQGYNNMYNPQFPGLRNNFGMIPQKKIMKMSNQYYQYPGPNQLLGNRYGFGNGMQNQFPYQQQPQQYMNQMYPQQPMQQYMNQMYPQQQQQGYNNMYNQIPPYQQQPQQYMNQMYPQQQFGYNSAPIQYSQPMPMYQTMQQPMPNPIMNYGNFDPTMNYMINNANQFTPGFIG